MAHEVPEWGGTEHGGTRLYVPYNEDFVEALKGLVPSAKRRWIPEDEAWWIHDDLLDEVEELLHEQFPDYE